MDGEAGWWTTSGNIGLPPLARAMGVGRQQQAIGPVLSQVQDGKERVVAYGNLVLSMAQGNYCVTRKEL